MAKSKSMTFFIILLTLITGGRGDRISIFPTYPGNLPCGESNRTLNPPEKEYPDLDSGPVFGTPVLRIDNVIIKETKTNLNLKAIRKPKMLIFMPGGNVCRRCAEATHPLKRLAY